MLENIYTTGYNMHVFGSLENHTLEREMLKLGDSTAEGTVVGVFGILLVVKEGSDVTELGYLSLLINNLKIPTNMKNFIPIVAEVPNGITFCGVTFKLEYGPYKDNNCQNYKVSFQGQNLTFEVNERSHKLQVVR